MAVIYQSYIDAVFLRNHYANKPKDTSEFFDSNSMKVWKSINEFLIRKTNICLFKMNLDETDLQSNNPIAFNYLNDYWQNKTSQVELIDSVNEMDIFSKRALSHFFFTDSIQLGFSPASIGVVKFDSNKVIKRWLDNPNLANELVISGEQLVQNQLNSWNDFSLYGVSTNSIVILDNYIFSNEQNIFNNFSKFIEKLFSVSLTKCPLSILVITKKFYSGLNNMEAKMEDVFKKVNRELKNVAGQRQFELTIVKKGKAVNKLHDRNVITNYLRFNFSNSISFFNKYGKAIMPSDVTVTVLPHIGSNGNETYGDISIGLLKRVSQIMKENSSEIMGSRKSHLLEFTEELFNG